MTEQTEKLRFQLKTASRALPLSPRATQLRHREPFRAPRGNWLRRRTTEWLSPAGDPFARALTCGDEPSGSQTDDGTSPSREVNPTSLQCARCPSYLARVHVHASAWAATRLACDRSRVGLCSLRQVSLYRADSGAAAPSSAAPRRSQAFELMPPGHHPRPTSPSPRYRQPCVPFAEWTRRLTSRPPLAGRAFAPGKSNGNNHGSQSTSQCTRLELSHQTLASSRIIEGVTAFLQSASRI